MTAAEEASYGRFEAQAPEQAVVERFFFLDDADLDLVAKRRGDRNRLGFSLQLVTVRQLGTFLEDPLDVPTTVADYVAGQVGVADPSCVKGYWSGGRRGLSIRWRSPRYTVCLLRLGGGGIDRLAGRTGMDDR